MRRLVMLFSAATLSLATGVIATSAVASGGTATTEPSSSATEAHPIIGTWMIIDPEGAPSLAAFSADGIVVNVETDGIGLGVWEPTGPTGASVTFMEPIPAEEIGSEGASVTIRATIEVDPDGQSLTGDYTVELSGVEALTGEYGPGTVTGTRVAVEPMGTPVGSLEELFGGFEEGTEVTEGTAMAEATEVAAPPTTG